MPSRSDIWWLLLALMTVASLVTGKTESDQGSGRVFYRGLCCPVAECTEGGLNEGLS